MQSIYSWQGLMLLTRRYATISASSDSGKTTTDKGFAEHLMSEGRLYIRDPTGLLWGLRVLANYHMLGYLSPHGDLDIGEAAAQVRP
jgi:hypothetical protein